MRRVAGTFRACHLPLLEVRNAPCPDAFRGRKILLTTGKKRSRLPALNLVARSASSPDEYRSTRNTAGGRHVVPVTSSILRGAECLQEEGRGRLSPPWSRRIRMQLELGFGVCGAVDRPCRRGGTEAGGGGEEAAFVRQVCSG